MSCPPELQRDEFVPWSRGRGVEVWAMFVAAMNGDLETIEKLVARDPGLVECEFEYLTPLHFAVRQNQRAVVKYLLGKGIDPNYGFGQSPMEMARQRGYMELGDYLEAWLKEHYGIVPEGETMAAAIKAFDISKVRELIGARPELVHAADKRGNRPMHWAALTRQIELIDYLLSQEAEIGVMRPDGARPIDLTGGDYHYRSWYRDLPPTGLQKHEVVVGYLMARGAYCDISVAAKIGYYQRVKELLDQDAGLVNRLPDYVTYYNGLPLRNAAAAGHMEIVKLLLERGANVNEPEPGIAPFGGAMHSAIGGRQYAIARLLLERGADPNATVESSGDLLHMARHVGAPAEFIELIASRATNRNKDVVGYELDADALAAMLAADPDAPVDHYLGYLISADMQPQLELILRCQPDIFRKQTLLSGAWWDGGTFKTPEQARWLMEHGLDPRLRNWLGMTALHRCAAKGLIDVAAVLLEFGADINAVETERAETPRAWAVRHGNEEMAEWLRGKGGI